MCPEVVKKLLAQPPATESVLSRYAGRSDDRPPSMVFSESTLQLAMKTFTQGRFKGKNHFQNQPKMMKVNNDITSEGSLNGQIN